jgi:transposase-like protein
MMTKHTLESVQADFQQWRQTKLGPRSRIPESLKQKAVALLTEVSPSKISTAINVSNAMLKAWAAQNQQDGNPASGVKFVALSPDTQPATSEGDGFKLDATMPNGNHWSLQGQVSVSLLETFISAVSGGQQ